MNKLNPHWACCVLMCSTVAVAQTPTPHITPTVEVGPAETPANQASDETSATEEQKSSLSEVVVTGTLIRGIAPAGANVISIGTSEIENLGPSQPAPSGTTGPTALLISLTAIMTILRSSATTAVM